MSRIFSALLSRRWLALVALGSLAAAAPAQAAWPEAGHPVRIIVGFPPGGGADALARAISAPLGEQLQATVIVENRAGAGGLVATEAVAKSPADGYTLYLATPGSFTIWPNLRKLSYEPQRDFAPVSLLVTMPNVLVTSPGAPYKTVPALIARAKAAQPELSYASGGNGTIGQIAAEQFKLMAGVPMQHVPYKGTSPAISDVMAGLVPMTFSDPSVKALVDAGKLRALAVTTAQRSPQFPDLPTLAESGVPGYEVMNWYGLVAPANTPPDVVQRLNQALVKVMGTAEVRQRLASAGMDATSGTPAQFGDLMARERSKWGELIRKAGIRAE
ncbi:MAG: tripartite tricarboxylate transporter substrate binding protein [Burkholderiales bacterium]|nr:tripartite tricarboxylate transporter substrate binding protein [Burkholderiales bacterium]